MLFNSIEFALFLPIVFFLYWKLANDLKYQNFIILVAGYVFYGWWDYRFVFLLAFSTLLDFYTGLNISTAENKTSKKIWLLTSIFINLGFLCFFKYYNFFIDSFADLLRAMGLQPHYSILQVVLPIGISFYTFHGLSYIIDIYNNKSQPTKSLLNYAVFVCFFPLLIAGPIERASHLLPQVEKPRAFNYARAVDGARQIVWGLFKKMVIADQCAEYVNLIFNEPQHYNGSTLLLGAVLFAFQIYGDFSGYSDIAIGTAKLFGFEVIRNFAFPYFSRDIAEFWRRWHISLSSWFRDYVYIPMGGSKGSLLKAVINTLIIFLISGFWHGANWTFLVWGLVHALLFIPLLMVKRNRVNLEIVAQQQLFPSIKEIFQILTTFLLVTMSWIFFRAESLTHAFNYLGGIFSMTLFDRPSLYFLRPFPFIILMIALEWINRSRAYGFDLRGLKMTTLRRAVYFILFYITFLYGGTQQEFIYFQF